MDYLSLAEHIAPVRYAALPVIIKTGHCVATQADNCRTISAVL